MFKKRKKNLGVSEFLKFNTSYFVCCVVIRLLIENLYMLLAHVLKKFIKFGENSGLSDNGEVMKEIFIGMLIQRVKQLAAGTLVFSIQK